MKQYFLLSLACLSINAFAAIDEVWKPTSSPDIMTPNTERLFSRLPLKGEVTDHQKFWSGDYWALNAGNINIRWNTNSQKGFNLTSPTLQQAMLMSQDDLAQLSPTEKYDLWAGNYSYPLKSEVSKIANRKAEDWEGICHGWAPAAMNHHEPTPKLMTSVDGLVIPFGSSDIKALISYYYAWGFQTWTVYQTGTRCFKDGLFSSKKNCPRDLNAGAFHIILGNKIGLESKGFIADLDKGDEVWNHPIRAYSSEVTKESNKANGDSARGTVRVIRVKTTITYVSESDNYWDPIIGTDRQVELTKKYEYDLDLGPFGEILGGKWKSSDRPDFLWLKEKPQAFEGSLARLGELLND